MKNRLFPILIGILLMILFVKPVFAQEEQLVLDLNRDIGYGGFGNDIQGWFSLLIQKSPPNIIRVEFTIDDGIIGEDNKAPFRIQFSTDSYPHGEHTLTAIGYAADGQIYLSNKLTMDFVSPEAGWLATMKIIGPILGIVGGVLLLSFLLSIRIRRKQANLPLGAPRNYGLKGGTICPKCSRPFTFQMLALNLGFFHKIDRCPHCGRWGIVRRKSLEELRTAEAAELVGQPDFTSEISEEDRLRKDLEDSRYQNL